VSGLIAKGPVYVHLRIVCLESNSEPTATVLKDYETSANPAPSGYRDNGKTFCVLLMFELVALVVVWLVVSVLATGLKGCGFESGESDGFLRAIKIHSIPLFRMGSKAGGPMS
jgi:hypothetical protein